MARLLSPSEYGLLAMLAIFFALGTGFSDAGFTLGLVQRKEVTPDDETSVFAFNLVAGVVLAVTMCTIAPWVAAFYGHAVLKDLLRVSSLQFVFISFGLVQYALLMRRLEFRTRATISNAASLAAGAVGIGMAWSGAGVWSLVGQNLSRLFLLNSLIWFFRSWRPAGRFSWKSIKGLWPFSSRLMATYLLNTAFENVYSVAIGRLYTPADLGHFTRASGLAQLPGNSVTDVVTNVTFPAFSRIQGDRPALVEKFRKSVRALAALHFPVMAGLAAVAEPLVRCLLTEKWLPCVPYLRILCAAGVLLPFQALHRNLLTALGRSDLVLKSEIAKKALAVIVLAITIPFGVPAMAWGIMSLSAIYHFVSALFASHLTGYSLKRQAADIAPFLGLSACDAVLAAGFGGLGLGASWLLLVSQILFGATFYTACVLFLGRTWFKDTFASVAQVWSRLLHDRVKKSLG